MLRRPTDAEVIKRFGDPHPYVLGDGSVDPKWETEILQSFRDYCGSLTMDSGYLAIGPKFVGCQIERAA